eukprot:TRINITY_DN14230_c0_g1_i7.p1 TRINITY_DN14230_c0_g1~~TRINITY_DN14230_c0_g1_i7.p1  ORF type:complete len:300 (-),score=61.94 TRINITY_DN14230_c0_g1_i7:2122-3021(-)
MYTLNAKSRFNLLHLQEGEEYLKDYQGSFKFINPETDTSVIENGTVHLCSHSIILEAENPSISLYKYLFKFMSSGPEQVETKSGQAMRFECKRAIEVLAGKTPQPHRRHELESARRQRVEIALAYTSVSKLVALASYLYRENRKNLADVEYREMIKEFTGNEKMFEKTVFDKTRIKDISEMPLISKELRVSQILPLVQIDGLFYLTDKRIYFQPLHSFYAKPLFSFKIKNITGLYKRRYKLRPVIVLMSASWGLNGSMKKRGARWIQCIWPSKLLLIATIYTISYLRKLTKSVQQKPTL